MTATQEGFWDFSLRVYAAPGVAELCLALQDGHGADVDVLLWCAWAGAQGIVLDRDALAAAMAATAPWRDGVVRPLRAVRRALRSDIGAVPAAEAAALRVAVKAAELEAERVEHLLLARLLPRDGPRRPARDAVAANLGGCVALLGAAGRVRLEPLSAAALPG